MALKSVVVVALLPSSGEGMVDVLKLIPPRG